MGVEAARPRPGTLPPVVPEGGAYAAPPQDEQRRAKIRHMGIDESQARPADESQGNGIRGWGYMLPRDESWRPTRLRFHKEWPPNGEVPTDWYKLVWVHLYLRVADFSERYFGYGDIENERHPWVRVGFSKQFLNYVDMVARQDNYNGGWDRLLTDRRRRQFLVQGVIARILQRHVWDQLLFGADEQQKAMLDSMDIGILSGDGYPRTDIRGQAIRVALGARTLPKRFWKEVDSLNAQMAELLMPLFRFMDLHFPEARSKSIRAFCQDLHHIVSEAGYFAVGVRWSRTIFRYDWPFVGEPWQLEHDQADGELYTESKRAVEDADVEAAWRAAGLPQPPRRLDVRDGGPDGEGNANNNGDGDDDDDADGEDDYPQGHYQPERIAKVQIICWPLLIRYTANPKPCEGPSTRQTVEMITRAQVVHHLGGIADHYEVEEDTPHLQDHIRKNASFYARILYGLSNVWGFMCYCFAFIWYWSGHLRQTWGEQDDDDVEFFLEILAWLWCLPGRSYRAIARGFGGERGVTPETQDRPPPHGSERRPSESPRDDASDGEGRAIARSNNAAAQRVTPRDSRAAPVLLTPPATSGRGRSRGAAAVPQMSGTLPVSGGPRRVIRRLNVCMMLVNALAVTLLVIGVLIRLDYIPARNWDWGVPLAILQEIPAGILSGPRGAGALAWARGALHHSFGRLSLSDFLAQLFRRLAIVILDMLIALAHGVIVINNYTLFVINTMARWLATVF